MNTVLEAVQNAKKFAADALGVAQDVLLEEVKSDTEQFHITLSFPHRLPSSRVTSTWAAQAFENPRREQREFKVFDVDKQTGEVLGMAIRSLQA